MRHILQVIFALSLLGALLLYPYLVGQKLFVFTDVGKDFLEAGWPSYLNITRTLSRGEFPVYSDAIGLGTNMYFGNLRRTSLVDPFVWMTIGAVAVLDNNFIFALPWIVLLKIIASGLGFYVFLRISSRTHLVALLGALAYAFSGQMLVRAGWYHFTTEMVVIPLLSIAVVLVAVHRKLAYLAIIFFWIGLYHPYYALVFAIYGVLLLLYILLITAGTDVRKAIVGISRYCVTVVIGILLAGIVFLPSAYSIVTSARLESTGKVQSFFSVIPEQLITVNFFRFYGNDLLGVSDEYSGLSNTLEDPILYIGLLPLVLLPISFLVFRNKKEVLTISIFICLFLAYLYIPEFTRIINGGYGSSFKTSGFIITIFLLLWATRALDNLQAAMLTRSHKFVVSIGSLLPLFLFGGSIAIIRLFPDYFSVQLDSRIVSYVFFFLVIYWLLVSLYAWSKKPAILRILVIIFACEMFTFGQFTLLHRQTLRHSEFEQLTKSYLETRSVIDQLPQNDWFRIDKNYSIYGDAGVNDAVALGYPGVRVYNSFNSSSFRDFALGFSLMDGGFSYRYLPGISADKIHLLRILGVRYYITDKADPISDGNVIVHSEDLTVSEDTKALAFGTVFYQTIPESEFEQFDEQTKLSVLPTTLVTRKQESSTAQAPLSTFKFNNRQQTVISGEVTTSSPGYIYFPLLFDIGWELAVDEQPVDISKAYFGLMYAPVPAGTHEIELHYRQPWLREGIVVSVLTVCIVMFYNKNRLIRVISRLRKT